MYALRAFFLNAGPNANPNSEILIQGTSGYKMTPKLNEPGYNENRKRISAQPSASPSNRGNAGTSDEVGTL